VRRRRAAGPSQPDPVEDRRWRANARQPVKALKGVDQGPHGTDATAAINTVPCVAVKAAAGARAQLTLDVVGQMLL
jgi:hypothetical protein